MTIQNNLKWDKHVEKIRKKASKRLYFLSQFKRAKVQSKDLLEFYVTCIRPVLTYACEVFNFNLQEKLKSSLERIQKRAMRIIDGYDTPYDVASELSSLERLSAYRDNLCDDFLLKVSVIRRTNCIIFYLLIRTETYLQETLGNVPSPSVIRTVLKIPLLTLQLVVTMRFIVNSYVVFMIIF